MLSESWRILGESYGRHEKSIKGLGFIGVIVTAFLTGRNYIKTSVREQIIRRSIFTQARRASATIVRV